jgi:WD40 repeat protein
MKLTDRDKRTIPVVIIAALILSLLFLYPRAEQPDQEPTPPATGEVRELPFSLIDWAISTWYEKTTKEPVVAIIRQDIPAQIGAISPDGRYIAAGGTIISAVAISSVEKKRIVRKIAINYGIVMAVAFSPDGRYLATGRRFMPNARHNESVNIWDAESGRLIRNLPGPSGPNKIENDVKSVAFSPDSRYLAVGYAVQPKGDSVHVFDVETGARLRVMHPSRVPGGPLFFLDRGALLGYGELGGDCYVYDVNTGNKVQQLHAPGVCALSPDGRYVATGARLLRIIDRETGGEVKTLGEETGYYRVLAFSPDGRYLGAYSDGSLVLWDVTSGRKVRELKAQPDIVGYSIGFDAEGKYFMAVCNKYVVVWDFRKLISEKVQ